MFGHTKYQSCRVMPVGCSNSSSTRCIILQVTCSGYEAPGAAQFSCCSISHNNFAAAGVASGDDVQVRCTISSVSVAVPGRYLLQLSLPFCIKDEAESAKFSSRKQPSTLTVTLAVEGSIAQQQAPQLSVKLLPWSAAA
jgi:hypothetical protein